MAIDKDTISSLIYDPALMQRYILEELDDATKGEYTVVDPTNPFTMLLESAVTCASSSIIEASNLIRKQYPSLASLEDDLYHHITDNESTYMFATPSECTLRFYVNAIDLRNYGVEGDNGTYVETVIPTGTTITALDTTLTLLNDILVRLYYNGTVFVEQQLNKDNDIAYEDTGILDAKLLTDASNTSWVGFETKVKQVSKVSINKAVVVSSGFKEVINLTDSFCHASISYKSSGSDGYTELTKMFNDEYVDPLSPGVVIKVYDKNILVKIPDQYLVEEYITGNVKIDIYETKGYQYLPLNRYTVADFTIVKGDTGKSSQAATSKNIAIMAVATSLLTGGKDAATVDELRSSIINNTTGDIDLPITEKQIEQYGNINGYTITKNLDILTEREFLGLKSAPEIDSSLVYAYHTAFFNTAKIVIDEIKDYKNIIVTDDRFIIKSNTVFKNNNSVFTILSNEELEYIDALDNYTLIDYLKANKLFFNPFYYVIEKNDSVINSRVYDLDNPVINSTFIKEKNTAMSQRVNVKKYSILKSDRGYTISLNLSTNTSFDNLEQRNLVLQLRIPLYGGTSYAYINGVYDNTKEIYNFELQSNLSISEDGEIDLQNGTSVLSTKAFELVSNLDLYICSIDINLVDPTDFLKSEVDIKAANVVVFTKEQLRVTFGEELKYIYNNIYNTYSERKYKTYDEDVPLLYTENIYKVNPDTGLIITVTYEDSKYIGKYTLLHKKGDPVLDENDEPVYLYRKGETVVGEDGLPIVDLEGGVVRHIDMLMMEYEFLASNSNAYLNYNKLTIEALKYYIVDELSAINNKLLEKTTVKYKSFNTTNNLAVVTNNTTTYINNNCSPKVLLYIQNTGIVDNETKDTYKTLIGSIFNTHFTKSTIVLEDIKAEIKSRIGSTITGVKITNIDAGDNEIINIKDSNNRLFLNKLMDINKNNELIVKYDVDLDIVYI